jgi:hypothetical protein
MHSSTILFFIRSNTGNDSTCEIQGGVTSFGLENKQIQAVERGAQDDCEYSRRNLGENGGAVCYKASIL